ncbi:MAG: polysaccharide deacetylase family protein [Anaerolineae bacterium]
MQHRVRAPAALAVLVLALASGLLGLRAGRGGPATRLLAGGATPWPTAAPTATLAPSPTPTPPPPRVLRTYPIEGDGDTLPGAPLQIVFDQPMDPGSTLTSCEPALPLAHDWPEPHTLHIRAAWEPAVAYTVTVHACTRAGSPLPEPVRISFQMGGDGAASIPILMYHHVEELGPDASQARRTYTVSPIELDAHLQALESLGAHVVSLQAIADYMRDGEPLPSRPVALTFDDGHESAFRNAVPVLQAHGATATFFITPCYVDGAGYVSAAQVRQLVQAGFTIGDHGYCHRTVAHLSAAGYYQELAQSRRRLEELSGAPVRLFAYPYGLYSRTAMEQVAALGHAAAVAIGPVTELRRSQLYALARQSMSYDKPVECLLAKLPWHPDGDTRVPSATPAQTGG